MEETGMKMKCSVIQDLLPSYVDEICSQDTRELVQEHVAECEQCRNKLEQMKHTEIVTVKAPEKQIDYLKKIKRSITRKEWLGKFMLIALTALELMGLFSRGVGPIINFSEKIAVLFSILSLCGAVLAGNFEFTRKRRTAAAEICLSAAVLLFLIALHEYTMQSVVDGRVPFSMKYMSEVGPFLIAWYRVVVFIEALILLRNTFGKQKNAYAVIVNIISLSLVAFFKSGLYYMAMPETYMDSVHVGEISQVILLVLAVVICALLQKHGKMPVRIEEL